MARKIQFLTSNEAGAKPSGLSEGEPALNVADGKLYFNHTDAKGDETVIEIGGGDIDTSKFATKDELDKKLDRDGNVSASWYIKRGDIIDSVNPFGGAQLYDVLLNDCFYALNKRDVAVITIEDYDADGNITASTTSNVGVLFDGDYENNIIITKGTTRKFRIKFNTNIHSIIGYPYGYLYLPFYYTSIPKSVSVRLYNNYSNRVGWFDIEGTKYKDASKATVYTFYQNKYYTPEEIEITIVAQESISAALTEISYIQTRGRSYEQSVVTKFGENSIYGDLSLRGKVLPLQNDNTIGASANPWYNVYAKNLEVANARISGNVYEGGTKLSDKYLGKNGTASKALADEDGNNIKATYAKKGDSGFVIEYPTAGDFTLPEYGQVVETFISTSDFESALVKKSVTLYISDVNFGTLSTPLTAFDEIGTDNRFLAFHYNGVEYRLTSNSTKVYLSAVAPKTYTMPTAFDRSMDGNDISASVNGDTLAVSIYPSVAIMEADGSVLVTGSYYSGGSGDYDYEVSNIGTAYDEGNHRVWFMSNDELQQGKVVISNNYPFEEGWKAHYLGIAIILGAAPSAQLVYLNVCGNVIYTSQYNG